MTVLRHYSIRYITPVNFTSPVYFSCGATGALKIMSLASICGSPRIPDIILDLRSAHFPACKGHMAHILGFEVTWCPSQPHHSAGHQEGSRGEGKSCRWGGGLRPCHIALFAKPGCRLERPLGQAAESCSLRSGFSCWRFEEHKVIRGNVFKRNDRIGALRQIIQLGIILSMCC